MSALIILVVGVANTSGDQNLSRLAVFSRIFEGHSYMRFMGLYDFVLANYRSDIDVSIRMHVSLCPDDSKPCNEMSSMSNTSPGSLQLCLK